MQTHSTYFLGANTPFGFFSYYDSLIDIDSQAHKYIIKGGPGTGKSTLMKRLRDAACARSIRVEQAACSSDPASLDAVVLPDMGIAVVDGTSPHTVDPKYPGAADSIINLGAFWDSARLKLVRPQIVQLSGEIADCFAQAYKYLAAARSLQDDFDGRVAGGVLHEKLARFLLRFRRKHFPPAAAEKGRETRRFLSSITPDGVTFFPESITERCRSSYLIDDAYGISHILISRMRDFALEAGLDAHSYWCATAPASKIEHLYIPALDLGFITSNAYHHCDNGYSKKISMNRFIDADYIKARRQRLRFISKAKRAMIDEAAGLLRAEKSLHDKLEALYAPCMDFTAADRLCDDLISEILRIDASL